MSNNKTISISFQLTEEGNGMKTITTDAKTLQQIFEATATEAKKFSDNCVKMASITTIINGINEGLTTLQKGLADLQGAYAAQVEVETQLAVNMRNTMGAREEDIQSIKDLCSAQQELGVIGDEVQLAGAQELATYLEKKESLQSLIPVMNDMLAQQYGLNATQENAAQIATMLGKVMEGQTGALSRYGYKFDEAQEQILKFGTESQRAAVLAEVVESAVGGMNAELAKTDVGKQKQLENTLGDIKESFGQLAQKILPTVTFVAQATTAVSGFIKVTQGLKTIGPMFTTIVKSVSTLTKEIRTAGLATKIFGVTLKSVLITSGIGLAIMAIGYAIGYLTGMLDDATESTNELSEAQQRAQEKADQLKRAKEQEEKAMKDSIATYNLNISRLKSFNGTKAEEERLCKEMNSAYGEAMGYYSSVNDWYSALTKNSATYCRQLVLEAKARRFANDIAEMEVNKDKVDKQIKELEVQLGITGGNNQSANTTQSTNTTQPANTTQPTWDYAADRRNKRQQASSLFLAGNAPTLRTDAIAGNTPDYTSMVKDWGAEDWSKTAPTSHGQLGTNFNALILTGLYSQQAKLEKEIEDTTEFLNGVNTELSGLQFERGSTTPHGGSGGGGAGGAGSTEPVYREEAATIAQVRENISALQQQRETLTGTELAAKNQEIKAWQDKLRVLEEYGVKSELPFNSDPKTIKDYAENIAYLNKQIETASGADLTNLNKQLKEQQEAMAALRNQGIEDAQDSAPKEDSSIKQLNLEATKLKEIQENITILNNKLQEADAKEAANINKQIELWQKKADAIENAGKATVNVMDSIKTTWSSAKGISSGIDSISDALEKNGTIWEKLQGVIDGFFQIFEGVSAIVSLINTMTEASQQHSAAKLIEGAAMGVTAGTTSADAIATEADTRATEANTQAAMENAAAKGGEALSNAAASGAKLPFPANIAAIAAGVVSVLAAVGCFAGGGIVGGSSPSGDRLVARVNSGEMILNRNQQSNLFRMLNTPALAVRTVAVESPQKPLDVRPSESAYALMAEQRPQSVRFRIDGRNLVGVLEKEINLNLRR